MYAHVFDLWIYHIRYSFVMADNMDRCHTKHDLIGIKLKYEYYLLSCIFYRDDMLVYE